MQVHALRQAPGYAARMLLGIDHLVIAVADPDHVSLQLERELGLTPQLAAGTTRWEPSTASSGSATRIWNSSGSSSAGSPSGRGLGCRRCGC